ncbi:MAG: GNAT family N-acetyltransferase [Gammaproteobacteria bacterium]|nr:GNAT family N-acetyltransferase [Gammaproteobacteria bacterium]
MVKYRTMQIDDYDGALALWQSADGVQLRSADSREGIARYLTRNPGLSFVAESGGKVVGTIMAGHDGRRGYIQHLAVKAQSRNAGIGSELLRRCLATLKQAGIGKSHVHILSDNHIAREFWIARGWELRDDIDVFSFVNDGDDNA